MRRLIIPACQFASRSCMSHGRKGHGDSGNDKGEEPASEMPEAATSSGGSVAKDTSQAGAGTPTSRPIEEIKEDMIRLLLSKDKEIFELKRLHELSMLRVEQNQNRIIKDQQDRGIYYEQNVNVATFDTLSVGQYTQRNTLYHMLGLERLRHFKMYAALVVTIYIWIFLYYRYIINDDMAYVREPLRKIGDYGALRRQFLDESRSDQERIEQQIALENAQEIADKNRELARQAIAVKELKYQQQNQA